MKAEFDPNDDIGYKQKTEARSAAEDHIKETTNMELNLLKDNIRVPKQEYACVSFVAPGLRQKNDSIGLKIKGCFETLEQAQEHAADLMKEDPTFDVYAVEMYNWLLVPPDPKAMENQVYHDERLNTLVHEHLLEQEVAKREFDLRKDLLMKNKDVNRELLAAQLGVEGEYSASELASALENASIHPSERIVHTHEEHDAVRDQYWNTYEGIGDDIRQEREQRRLDGNVDLRGFTQDPQRAEGNFARIVETKVREEDIVPTIQGSMPPIGADDSGIPDMIEHGAEEEKKNSLA